MLTVSAFGSNCLHHPRKGRTVAGQASRGSGALPGFVDIIIEMGYYSHPDDFDRPRQLIAFSRHDQTPRHMLIELQPDGADYTVLQSGVEAAFSESWQAVIEVLTAAYSKLTRQEILEGWPEGYNKPNSTTLWRWLSRAVASGAVRQEGKGHPSDPFRYWLPEREAWMRPDGGTKEEMQAWNDRCVKEAFGIVEGIGEARPAAEMAIAVDSRPATAAPMAEAETNTSSEIVPLEVTALASPMSDSQVVEPPSAAVADAVPKVRMEVDVRLPYPFNQMNPADVPEEVWKRARSGRENIE